MVGRKRPCEDVEEEEKKKGFWKPGMKLRSGFVKLLGEPVPKKRRSRECSYKRTCLRYVRSANIEDIYIDKSQNKCFCRRCHVERGDGFTYWMGVPRKRYTPPVGWFRLGLQVPRRVFSKDVAAFERWHRAFHGTKLEFVKNILKVGDLLMPGDESIDGIKIEPRPGHHPDPVRRPVYVSPSIKYSSLDTYASPHWYTEEGTNKIYLARLVLQVLIHPESYRVGPETIGASNTGWKIDPFFDNSELEWSTNKRGSTVYYGLLVKLEEHKPGLEGGVCMCTWCVAHNA